MISDFSKIFATSGVGYISNDTCLTTVRNATAISNIYEGIPETILLNVICYVVLILLFAILRNRAWDYGRLALMHNERWTQLFYKNTDDAIAIEESNADVSLIPDQGCLWFPSIFKLTRERIYSRCGPDAAHYLSFQKHLLILSFCVTCFSLIVILPIHYQGNLQGDDVTSFGHTTISNLPATSKWLWVHVAACFTLLPLSVYIMRKSSGKRPSATVLSSRTLMITHISRSQRNVEDLKNYFSVRYPGVEIKDIQIAYRVKKLMKYEMERETVREAKSYCVTNNKTDLKVQPYGCIICCPWKTENALQYYSTEEEKFNDFVRAERIRILERPLGIAFITLKTEEMAEHMLNSFQPDSIRHWIISKAPSPSDINWENLEISYRNWYSKAILINAILFLVLFFLTTPLILVNVINNLTSIQENFIYKLSPMLSEFLPTLLLLSFSAFLPVLVAYSDQWMSHWTKSQQNHATMHKTFFFLLFMVLILPSLGLTSAQTFVEWSIQTNQSVHWECIFLADKGAFFVNYVITSALIGTALELLRFPELAMYTWRLLRIKSEAEKITIRKQILSEFPFGIHYAWTLLIYTVSTVYSLSCPLITPFGLMYLTLKHFVDKYNIYYVYRPITMCGEGHAIHSDAVKMVRVSVLLLQLIMSVFFYIRGGSGWMTVLTLISLLVTGGCFILLSPFPTCKNSRSSRTNLSETQEQYIAPVLLSSQSVGSPNEVVSPSQSYGSNVSDITVRIDLDNSTSTA
ncbi:calcium permeable stress-gated cation channel 1 [Coccinella septempunctata]|uniref:calcium permeable stress-gated cation channel 1 n=1 Tax=Coccinella septempunctata TaxID=41139 RepID=UPI001D0934FF|nr:calcium permeable stress-gated cation channel 1 [Coccinella septempunctata]